MEPAVVSMRVSREGKNAASRPPEAREMVVVFDMEKEEPEWIWRPRVWAITVRDERLVPGFM